MSLQETCRHGANKLTSCSCRTAIIEAIKVSTCELSLVLLQVSMSIDLLVTNAAKSNLDA